MVTGCPLFSIVIATWNAAGTLQRCLASIFGQTSNCWELIVVDGGSTDGTVEILESHRARIAYWHSRPDRGIYDAWNQGLVRATGTYVMFLGADDALHCPGVLRELIEQVGTNSYDLVSSLAILRDAHGRYLRKVGAPWCYHDLPRRMQLVHPGLLHQRHLFQTYGLFDDSLRIVGDLEFLLRLPETIIAKHVLLIVTDVQDDGVSRSRFWERIRERRDVVARIPRIGRLRSWLYFLSKILRRPIAKLFNIPH